VRKTFPFITHNCNSKLGQTVLWHYIQRRVCFRGSVWIPWERWRSRSASDDPKHWRTCSVLMSSRAIHGGQRNKNLPEEGNLEWLNAYMQMWVYCITNHCALHVVTHNIALHNHTTARGVSWVIPCFRNPLWPSASLMTEPVLCYLLLATISLHLTATSIWLGLLTVLLPSGLLHKVFLSTLLQSTLITAPITTTISFQYLLPHHEYYIILSVLVLIFPTTLPITDPHTFLKLYSPTYLTLTSHWTTSTYLITLAFQSQHPLFLRPPSRAYIHSYQEVIIDFALQIKIWLIIIFNCFVK
jgi:hypothetical protein